MSNSQVILVDENDIEIGTAEKLTAHLKPTLHRAFSIYLYNSKQQILLHRRAMCKYHSAGLWTNTCCSHPQPGEDLFECAARRLHDELGINYLANDLQEVFCFTYSHSFDNDMHEYEYDHVLLGLYNGTPKLNPEECMDYRWCTPDELLHDLRKNPHIYTPWLALSAERVAKLIK